MAIPKDSKYVTKVVTQALQDCLWLTSSDECLRNPVDFTPGTQLTIGFNTFQCDDYLKLSALIQAIHS